MKKNKILLICALALGLPSVVSNVMHNETPIVAKAEAEQSICDLTFPDDNKGNNNVSAYTKEWIAKKGNYEFKIANANNNNWSKWNYIKFGNKNADSIGYIQSATTFSDIVNRIDITIDSITAANVKSIKLYTSNGADFSEINETINIDKLEKGIRSFSIASPSPSNYYKIEFDCQKGKSNGLVQVSKVSFYKYSDATTYSVSFKTNDGTDTTFETKTVIENENVVLPETNPTRNGYKFTGWYTNSEATEKFDETTKITGDLVLYAGWEETNYVSDVLTSENFTAASTTYKEFDNVKLNNAVYAGFSAKNTSYNNAIQLNDTKGMGIVSTTSGGKIRKITLAWNVNTSNGKSLNIYGSNEKYTSASDLYDSSKRGTIVGTLSKGETTLEITDNYKYVGVRSSNGALYLDSITFEWEPIKPTVDETILQSSYLFTKMINGENISNGIRFVGSVKEDKFANLSNVGFNFTLTSTDKNVTKDYAVETTKLYNIIDDSNKLVFENKEDETFTLDGYLSYSLILNNINETFNATIIFYSYAIIDGVTYNSKTTTINIVNGAKA